MAVVQPSRKFPFLPLLIFANIGFSFLAMFAFFMILFRKNILMALGSGLLALPGILFQPWMILFFVVPFGCFLAPLFGSLITGIVYRWLDSKGKFHFPRRFFDRIPRGRLKLLCLGYCLIAVLIFYSGYADLFSLNRGIPARITDSLGISNSHVPQGRLYFLNDFIDSEYIWMGTVSAVLLDSIVTQLAMTQVELNNVPDRFKKMPPYWWRFSVSQDMLAYATANFPVRRGGDGFHAFALWDPHRQILRIWIKDNF